MGREIIFEVWEDGKCIWPEKGHDLYVCGRDDATGYIAQLVYNKVNELLGANEEMTIDNLPDDAYVILLTCNDYERYLNIKQELQDYYDKDMAEIQKAKDTLEDLREARRHTGVYDEFQKFSVAMENTEDWLELEGWSRAGTMLEYFEKCYGKMLDFVNADNNPDREAVINKYKTVIILSE